MDRDTLRPDSLPLQGGGLGRGSSSPSRFARTQAKTNSARSLRSNMTEAEQRLWARLRRGQIADTWFRRQHPMGSYVLDFYCPALRLAIELDGGQHGMDAGLRSDKRRDAWLAKRGVTVLRFWNNEITGNIEGVLTRILESMTALRDRTPSLTLPLPGGGDTSIETSP